MDDLVAFVRARLDEDAGATGACDPGPWEWTDRGHSAQLKADGPGFQLILDVDQNAKRPGEWGITDSPNLQHIARQDPARVLREVEAKRQMLRVAFEHAAAMDAEFGDCCDADVFERNGCKYTSTDKLPLLRLLAAPYASHPNYRESWRP